jgi:hypothetical protein
MTKVKNVLELDTYTNGTIIVTQLQRYSWVEFEDGEPVDYGNVLESDILCDDEDFRNQLIEDDEFIWSSEILEDEMDFTPVEFRMLELEVDARTWKTTGKVLYTDKEAV